MTRKDHRRGGRSADAPTPTPPAKKARTTPPGRTREARPQKAPHREARGGADFVRIYGFHAVTAALSAPRRELMRLYATAAAAERLAGEIAARGVETRIVAAEDIAARLARDAVHQGVLLEAEPLAPIDISELPARRAWSWCSTRSPIRTTSARSCARRGLRGRRAA